MQGILVTILVGGIAGWLAGQIMRGASQGLVLNVIIGIIGGAIGGSLFELLGMEAGAGIAGAIVTATLGAVILLWLVGLLRRK